MAVIKSGVTSDQLTIDAISKAARVILHRPGFANQTWPRNIDGLYHFGTAVLASVSTAHTITTTGHAWLQMPTVASKRARLRSLDASIVLGVAVGADVTALYRALSFAKFTFTGTASGAVLTPLKRHTADPNAAADVRTAVTGMTVSAGALGATLLQAGFIDWTAIVTSGAPTTFNHQENAASAEWKPIDEDAFIDIGPGEGICFYQPDAGATTWRIVLNGRWDEYTP